MIYGSPPSREYPARTRSAPAPTERSQIYAQRYIPHLPAAGEVAIVDRSGYNRADVEWVIGFCTEERTERFLQMIPASENAVVDDCILRLKYWPDVIPEKQTRALMTGARSGSSPTWI